MQNIHTHILGICVLFIVVFKLNVAFVAVFVGVKTMQAQMNSQWPAKVLSPSNQTNQNTVILLLSFVFFKAT